jgi:hypothetical protein
MLKKFTSLPIFLLIAAGLCILIRGAGFVFVSQISNYFAIAIIIALTVKDCRAEKIPEGDSRQPLYKYAPCAALFFFFVTLIALETTMFSFGIMTTVALVCSVVVFFRHAEEKKKIILATAYIFGFVAFIGLISVHMTVSEHLHPPMETSRISEFSPGEAHLLEAVQTSTEGGGNTRVTITRQRSGVNLLVGRIEPRARVIFTGGWVEFHHIEGFRWDGDNRVYMYRVQSCSTAGGDSYVFDLRGRNWRRSVFTPEQSATEQSAPLISPTPQPTLSPTNTPLPTPSPYYTQKSGRITSIHGLIGADGAIHEFAEWVHIHIEDENGEEITLVATPATVMPFENLAEGEQVTAYILSGRRLSCEPRMYIASALVAGKPEGVGIYIHYFHEHQTTMSFWNKPVTDRFLYVNETVTSADGRVFVRTETSVITPFFMDNFAPTHAGYAIIYATTEEGEPTPIIEAMLISESFGVFIPESEGGVEFLLPKMYSFADFETFELPIFIEQELFELPLPMILHHCGTIMAPFKPIGENFWFVNFWINNGSPFGGPPSGPTFGTSGGGSGESARMIPGSNIAWGTGFSATFVTPPILVDGVFYVPLLGVFATTSPFPSTDVFIYNGEIHIVPAGWSILHGRFSARQGWGGDSPERPITANVSALPIFVEGRWLDIPSAILTEDAYDILLPIIPIAEALGFSLTLWDCGEIMYVDGCPMRGRFIIAQPSVDMRERFPDLRWPMLRSASFSWIDGELYGELWDFFRDALNVGGFASYTRIELFNTGAMWGIMP